MINSFGTKVIKRLSNDLQNRSSLTRRPILLTGVITMQSKQRGVFILEYVLILPLMALLLFSSMYLAMVFHDYNAINEVAREAARYGVVGNTNVNIRTLAAERCGALLTRLYVANADDIAVVRGKKSTLNNEKHLEVSIMVRKNHEHSTGMIDEFLPNTLSATVRMRVEQEADGLTDDDYEDEDPR